MHSRRQFVKSAAAVTAALAAPGVIRAENHSDRAIELVRKTQVIDMLGVFTVSDVFERAFLNDPSLFDEERIAKVRASGINVFHNAIGIGGPDAFETVLHYIGAWNGFITDHADEFVRVDSVDDLDRLQASGKVGIIHGIQNSEHFRTVDDVDLFYGLGQRVSQLTYNSQNRLATGSTDRVDGGISDYGAAIIERMNEVGMIVDVSHCGDRTTLDAFEISGKPVLITHSNCRALVPGHPRVKTDAAIRAMAKSGGVMGITAVRMFVRNAEPTTVEHVVDHIDHVVNLVGVEHVGIGTDSDLDGYDDLPKEEYDELRAAYKSSYAFREKIDTDGMDHPEKMFELTDALLRRGYNDDEISMILGGNFRRVIGQIWHS